MSRHDKVSKFLVSAFETYTFVEEELLGSICEHIEQRVGREIHCKILILEVYVYALDSALKRVDNLQFCPFKTELSVNLQDFFND